MRVRSLIVVEVLAAGLICRAATRAHAQPQGRVAVEFVTGHAGYVDEVWDNRATAGALVRVSLTPRLAIGPEVIAQRGANDDHEWLVTGTATYDLVDATYPGRRVVPFIVVGAGLARRSSLVGQGPGTVGLVPYVTHEFTTSGGVGVRMAITRQFFLSGDARLGWEPERRVTISVGWRP